MDIASLQFCTKAEPVVVMVRGSVLQVEDCLARAQKLEDAASGSSSVPKFWRSDLDLRKHDHDRICGTVPKDAARSSGGAEDPRESKRPFGGKVRRNDPVEASSRQRVPEPVETSRQRGSGKDARQQERQERSRDKASPSDLPSDADLRSSLRSSPAARQDSVFRFSSEGHAPSFLSRIEKARARNIKAWARRQNIIDSDGLIEISSSSEDEAILRPKKYFQCLSMASFQGEVHPASL